MKFIFNNIKLIFKLFFIISFLSVFSCADKENKPFEGKKIDIHKFDKSKASADFVIKIDQPILNNYWSQKGGYDTHSIPNAKLKFPLEITFSKNTDQEITDEYFSLANPVVDKKNIYILGTNGNVTSLNKNSYKINWVKKIFSDQIDFPNPGSIVVQLNGEYIYLHNGTDVILALNKNNGEIKFKFKNDFPFRGNITIKEDYLLANDYNDNLLAFL